MLVPPHFLVSTAFKKMRWKDEFRKWLPKLLIVLTPIGFRRSGIIGPGKGLWRF